MGYSVVAIRPEGVMGDLEDDESNDKTLSTREELSGNRGDGTLSLLWALCEIGSVVRSIPPVVTFGLL